MAKTLISSNSPYCTSQQFINRWDVRTIGQLLSDDGSTELNSTQVLASTLLTQILMEASGMVESACLVGDIYAVADLQALSGTNGGETLAGLVADLAMWRVWDRRPQKDSILPKRCEMAFEMLDQLRNGARIFGFQQTADAGHLHHELMSPAQVVQRNDRIVQASRLFGPRSDRDLRNPST